MTSAVLTPEQESIAHKIDTAGLALIGAGVAGQLMHQHGAPGGAIQRLGHQIHEAGPYMDLAGLALIAPPVMHPLAEKLAPKLDAAGVSDPYEQAKIASYVLGAAAARNLLRTGP